MVVQCPAGSRDAILGATLDELSLFRKGWFIRRGPVAVFLARPEPFT